MIYLPAICSLHTFLARIDHCDVSCAQVIGEFCQCIGQTTKTSKQTGLKSSSGTMPIVSICSGAFIGLLLIARTEHLDNVSPNVVNLMDEIITVSLPGPHCRQRIVDACVHTELNRLDNPVSVEAAVRACAVISDDITGLPLVDSILECYRRVRSVIERSVDEAMASEVLATNVHDPRRQEGVGAVSTSVQSAVMDSILLPRRFASTYSAYGVLPPTAVLLHGPPGTG